MDFDRYEKLNQRHDELWRKNKNVGFLSPEEKTEMDECQKEMNKMYLVWEKIKYDEKTGRRMWYEYRCYEGIDSADVHLWYRSHQQVEVIDIAEPGGMLKTLEERGEEGMPRTYNIKFVDGLVAEAWEDEIVESPDEFIMVPPPVDMLRDHVSPEKLKLKESHVMNWDDFLNESMTRAPLYHAIKPSYAFKALQKDGRFSFCG